MTPKKLQTRPGDAAAARGRPNIARRYLEVADQSPLADHPIGVLTGGLGEALSRCRTPLLRSSRDPPPGCCHRPWPAVIARLP